MKNTLQGRRGLVLLFVALAAWTTGCGREQGGPGETRTIAHASGTVASDARAAAKAPVGALKPELLNRARTFTDALPREHFHAPALEKSKAGFKHLAEELVIQAELDEAGKNDGIGTPGGKAP